MPIVAQRDRKADETYVAVKYAQGEQASTEQDKSGATLWLVAVCLLLTAVTGCATAAIGLAQAQHHPFYFDPVVYQYHCAELFWNIMGSNRFAAVSYELSHNAFYPLRTIPLALLSPSLLKHPLAPLATALPAYASCLFLLIYTVWHRSRSKLLAAAAALTFAAVPAVYHTIYGLHALWLDNLAALLMGCAFLCLANYRFTTRLRWLAAFTLCVALTAFARYVAVAYIAFSLYPILLFALVEKWKERPVPRASVCLHAALSVILPGVLCGPFLIAHAAEAYNYYHSQCYSLGSTLETSLSNLFPFLCDKLLSGPFALALTVIWCINFFASWREHKGALKEAAWISYPAVSFLFLNLCILRPWETGYIMWYAVPLLIAAALIPHASLPARLTNRLARMALIVAIPTLAATMFSNLNSALNPDASTRSTKIFDQQLAGHLVSIGPHTAWAAFFAEYSVVPIVEAFYQTGDLPRTPAELTFSVHSVFWKVRYPNQSDAQICANVTDVTNKKVQLAAVLADPQQALSAKTIWFDNNTTRQVAYQISHYVQTNHHQWQFIVTLDHPKYGRIALYRNTAIHCARQPSDALQGHRATQLSEYVRIQYNDGH